MTRPEFIMLVSAVISSACSSDDTTAVHDMPGDEETPTLQCGRLEVLVQDACEPVQVVAVEQRDFSFERAGWTLEGTLRYPVVESDGYLPPGVVIVHGSGPFGRQGLVEGSLGIGYSQPIAVYGSLAQQLAERGFAVLVYDKRSCFIEAKPECPHSISEYPGNANDILVDDYLNDARAAAVALAAEPDIASDVILIGHSQGAAFVPILAAEEEAVFGGVMLAGSMLPIPEAVEGQFDDLADWLEANDPGNPLIEQLRMEADKARAALDSIAAGAYPEPTYLGASVEHWLSWMSIQDQFPVALASMEEPVAAYFGDLDFNVGPSHVAQLQAWIAAGEVDVAMRVYPNLTHAFVYVIEETPGHTIEFSSGVVDDLVAWAVANGPS